MADASEFSIFKRKPAKENELEQKLPGDSGSLPASTPENLVGAEPLPPAASASCDPATGTGAPLSEEELEALFASESKRPSPVAASQPTAAAESAEKSPAPSRGEERRGKRRALISAPVRVRSVDLTKDSLDDVTTTLNVSRIGILLATSSPLYYRSMEVLVTFPHSRVPDAIHAEQPGRIVRINELPDGRRTVAVALGVVHRAEDFLLSNGKAVHADPSLPKLKIQRDPNSPKPLVLALDAEASIRESLKNYLANEGYDVITVTNAQEAREVLDQCTPSLLIAEIEGEGMPGYDICAHCKSTPRLQSIPVMLTTSSAYPSDYASAHSLGAVVCMAKPYRQERLGHVVKLLAPPPDANANSAPPRMGDPSRRHLASGKTAKAPSSDVNRRFRFGRKS